MSNSTLTSQILNLTIKYVNGAQSSINTKNIIGNLIEMCFKYQIEGKTVLKYINLKQTTSKTLENDINS